MFSFKKQKRHVEIETVLRRIRDLTCPGIPPLDGESRALDRQNRSVPCLVVPWENETFTAQEHTYAITKDISDRGVSLVLPQPLRAEEVVVGFWPTTQHAPPSDWEPLLVVAKVRQNVDIGGGFWQLGLELVRLLVDQEHVGRLRPLTARLLPKSALQQTSAVEAVCESLR